MNNVVELQPKRMHGRRGPIEWVAWYDKDAQRWRYNITVNLGVRTFEGSYPTEAEAREHIERFMRMSGRV